MFNKTNHPVFKKAVSVLLCGITVVILFALGMDTEAEARDAIGETYQYPKPEVMQMDIVMHPNHFLELTSSWEKEKYDAMVSMDSNCLEHVDVRLRGDFSLRYGLNSPFRRIPFKVFFSSVQSNKFFSGNTTFNLINCQTPALLFIELIAMETYRFMGIPTPEMHPVFLRINGENFGLYLAVEEINDAFIERHFPNTGTLYKGGKGDTFFERFGMLRTEIDNGGHTLESAVRALTEKESFDSYIDIDEFLRFFACEAFTYDMDGIIAQYRNYYLYDNSGKLVLLPWDKNYTFCVFGNHGNESPSVYDFEDAEKGMKNYDLLQQIIASPKSREQYYKYIEILNNRFLDPSVFLPWLDSYINYLTPFFQKDPTILVNTDRIYEELTTGNALFSVFSGNLLRTFEQIHMQTNQQLQHLSSGFTIPEGCMPYPIYSVEDFAETYSVHDYLQGYLFRAKICTGYWKNRRQVYWQSYGTQTAVISGVFLTLLILSALSVFVPKGKKRRRSHWDDVGND